MSSAELGPVPDVIARAYDPERFRADGHAVVDALADHLATCIPGDDLPVIPWIPPSDALARWPADFSDEPAETFPEVLARTIAGSTRLHHPRYVGHQVPPPVPGAALADAAGALLNNAMAVYEMGGTAVPQEFAVVTWMARVLGMPPTAGGLLTSGGSIGNLTALLAARQAAAGFDTWTDGAHAGPPLAVLVAGTAHYSIARAVRALGWGDAGAVTVAVDEAYRMRADDLPRAHAAAIASGRRPIAVVASARRTDSTVLTR
jgi:L-2,4-diaminobutyrate decarboxylase